MNLLINGKRAVTADTALALADVFGTTPEFWMNLQAAVDLWLARRRRASGARASSGKERQKSGVAGKRLSRALEKGKLVSVAKVPAGRMAEARRRARGAKPTPAHRRGHDA